MKLRHKEIKHNKALRYKQYTKISSHEAIGLEEFLKEFLDYFYVSVLLAAFSRAMTRVVDKDLTIKVSSSGVM